MHFIAFIFIPLLGAIDCSKIGHNVSDFKSANEEYEKKYCEYTDMYYIDDYEFSKDQSFDYLIEGKGAVLGERETWNDGKIPYVISHEFNAIERNAIEAAMFHFEQNTCIRFRPRNEEDIEEDYLEIEKSSKCFSWVGRQGYDQKVSLSTRECFSKSSIMHYLMRAMGFYNEHNRIDRDKYVTILWDNIENKKQRYFCKYSSENILNFTEPYDFNSVMHYTELTYSKDKGSPTIVAKSGVKIGPKNESLSKSDIIKIKKLYYCPDIM